MIHFSHWQTAAGILRDYQGREPLHLFCKKHFARHKKYGSRDRKVITSLCFQYFRLGKAFPDMELTERILLAHFYCTNSVSALLDQVRPEWGAVVTISLADKQQLTQHHFGAADLFPLHEALSDGMEIATFAFSFLQQPRLFLRIRPGKETLVHQQLQSAGITFESPSPTTLALSNTTTIDTILGIDRDVVVQDWSSQRVGVWFERVITMVGSGTNKLRVWDCCAASGGKSILMFDLLAHRLQLTVSDIRSSILHNLEERFARAGLERYQSFVCDLTRPQSENGLPSDALFDIIVCDAPCSGSGTWARTPEQLFYFHAGQIEMYSQLQYHITRRVVPHLAPGGCLVYITCSAFLAENEAQAKALLADTGLEWVGEELLTGYAVGADTMYVAVFRNAVR